MNQKRLRQVGWLVNVLVPGGGVILIGGVVPGLLVGALFAVQANLLLAGLFIVPDELPQPGFGVVAVLAVLTYATAQAWYARELRRGRALLHDLRRRCVAEAQRRLAAGDADGAHAALARVASAAEYDLLVAVRVAQVLTARGEVEAARAAWARVRRLDRHRIYREQIARAERAAEPEGELP